MLSNGKQLIRKAGYQGKMLLWEYRCTCGAVRVADYHIIDRYAGCEDCRTVHNQHEAKTPGEVIGGFTITGPHQDFRYPCICRNCGAATTKTTREMRRAQKCDVCRDCIEVDGQLVDLDLACERAGVKKATYYARREAGMTVPESLSPEDYRHG